MYPVFQPVYGTRAKSICMIYELQDMTVVRPSFQSCFKYQNMADSHYATDSVLVVKMFKPCEQRTVLSPGA